MRGPVDVHCHMLPGIDDGAQELKDTADLLQYSAKQGVKEIFFTPHFYPEHITFEEFVSGRENAAKSVAPLAEKLGINFKVGAECRISPFLSELPLEQLAYAGTNYLLLELTWTNEPYGVAELIERLNDRGYTPILAHIERYPFIMDDFELLYRWERIGALAQINANWIISDKKAKKTIEMLFDHNLVHVMGSDAHSLAHRPPNLMKGYNLLPDDIAKAFLRNSLLLFDGQELPIERPSKPQRRFGGRWV